MFAENAHNFKKFKESIFESIESRTKVLESSTEFKEHVVFGNIKEYWTDGEGPEMSHYELTQLMNIADFWNYSEVNGYVEEIDIDVERSDALVVDLDQDEFEEEDEEFTTDV
jgi:hypothetical protein